MGEVLVARWATDCFAAMRLIPLLFLVFTSCGVHVRGEHFRSDYAGKCSAVNSPFAKSVTQNGTAVGALRAALIDALNDNYSQLQYCYSEALANQPTTRGRFVLRMLVDGDGRMREVIIPADNTGFPELACCVATVVKGLRLPATHAPGRFGFDYPFYFHTIYVVSAEPTLDYAYAAARKDGCEVILDGSQFQWAVIESAPSTDASHLTEDKYASPGDPLE